MPKFMSLRARIPVVVSIISVAAIAGAVLPAVPAYAASSVSLTVNSFSRSSTTSLLSYNMTVTAADHQGYSDTCTPAAGHSCTAGVQMKYASTGAWVNIISDDSFWSYGDPHTRTFSDTFDVTQISQVRAFLSGGNGTIYGAAQDVTDWLPTPSVSVTVNSISRSTTNPVLAYDVTVGASNYQISGGPCASGYGYSCLGGVQVRYATDSTVDTIAYSSFKDKSYPYSYQFTGSQVSRQIDAVRAYLGGPGGTIYSAWESVSDWSPVPEVGLVVNSFERSTADGWMYWDFDITGTNYQNVNGAICENYYGANCQAGVQIKRAGTGDLYYIASSNFRNQNFPYMKNEVGSERLPEISQIRAYLHGEDDRWIYGEWIDVDDFNPTPEVNLSINSLGRSVSDGSLVYSFDVDASYYALPGGQCSAEVNFCAIYAYAELADGTDVYLGGTSISNTGPYPATGTINASLNVAGNVQMVQARIEGPGGAHLNGAWQSVSDFLPNEAIGGNNAAEKSCVCTFGDPVNTATGEFFLPVQDLAIAGVGPEVGVSRTYSSTIASQNGPFGYGWSASFASRITVVEQGDVSHPLPKAVDVVQENGSAVRFTRQSDQTYAAPDRVFATLEFDDVAEEWRYVRQGVEFFTFDVDGLLTQISDPNGNAVDFAYSAGRVSSISGGGSRAITVVWSSGRISKLQDSAGREVLFTYDGSGNLVEVVAADGREAQYAYNSGHLMTVLTSPGGGETTNEYDLYDRVVAQTDPLDRELTFAYSGLTTTTTGWDGSQTVEVFSEGRIVKRTLAAGTPIAAVSTYEYDGAGNLTRQTDAAGETSTHAYDERGNLISTTDALGGVTSLTYDSLNRITSMIDPLGRESLSTYDTHGNLTSTTNPSGRATVFTRNGDGTISVAEDANGEITSFEYDSAGRLISTTDPNSLTASIAYDSAGFMISSTDAGGHVTTVDVDSSGRVLEMTDAMGHSTTYEYDSEGNQVSVEDPEGNTRTATFDLASNLLTSTDGGGAVTHYTYTSRGLPGTVTDPDGRVDTTTYDVLGRPITATDGASNVTSYAYDFVGNLIGITRPSGAISTATFDALGRMLTSTDPLGEVTTYGYDEAGQRTSITDPLDRVTTTDYALDGRVLSVTFPDLSRQDFDYNLTGQLTAFTDQDGLETLYSYDGGGRLASKTAPGGATTSYTYDSAGRLLASILPDASEVTNTYDDANRLIEQAFSAAGATSVEFSYDDNGRRTEMTDATGTSTYGYDSDGRLTSQANGAGGSILYSYTDGGLLDSLTYPGGRVVEYSYTPNGLMASVEDWDSNVTSFTWTEDSQLESQSSPNGLVQGYDYDAAGRPTDISVSGPSGVLAEYGYTYSEVGSLVSSTTTDPIFSAATWSYSYDEQDKITTSDDGTSIRPFLSTSGGQATTLRSETLEYNSSQQLTSSTPSTGPATSFGYDAKGARTSAAIGASPAQATNYDYDALSNLSAVTLPGDIDPSITYVSDGDGLRQRRVEGVTEKWLWSTRGAVPLLLSDDSYSYVYGPNLTPIEQIDETSGVVTYLHGDLIGSVRLITDANGDVAGASYYDEYGKRLEHAGVSDSAFGYSGNWTEAETGLVYMRARDYDPETASFLVIDPIVDTTHQPYSYASNNPLTVVDPLGLDSISVDWWWVGAHLLVPSIAFGIDGVNSRLAQGHDLWTSLVMTLNPAYAVLDGYGNEAKHIQQGCSPWLIVLDALGGIGGLVGTVGVATGAGGVTSSVVSATTRSAIPTLEFSVNKMPGITNNIQNAIDNGAPTTLIKVSKKEAQANRRDALKGQTAAPQGMSLDEYPFACSAQGGCGSTVAPVEMAEQHYQGWLIMNFFKKNGVGVGDPFRVKVVP